MSNMSYCRFRNTKADLEDCLDSVRRDELMNISEVHAGIGMVQEFLTFCRDYGIIQEYDDELVRSLFNGLKERESDEEADRWN